MSVIGSRIVLKITITMIIGYVNEQRRGESASRAGSLFLSWKFKA